MSAATITQAQDKGLRHQFGALFDAVRGFATGLYAAHGGWLAPNPARARQHGRDQMMALADQAQAYSPNLSNELRYIASRG